MFQEPAFKNIDDCASFTRLKLGAIRGDLATIGAEGISVVVNGSYARGEASIASDFDYFLLVPDGVSDAKIGETLARVKEIVSRHVGKEPAPDGAFSASERVGEFAKVIGGEGDTNQQTTRRMLFLTEGK